ncbi:MAG TPA: hypothetical protein VHJ82_06860 [Actinomycetota bacterium]|nr:hypothetical protein [Actinomycetota bacterium]
MNGNTGAGAGPLDRLAGIVEFVSSLDRRLLSAFEALDEMKRELGELGSLRSAGDELVADIRRRIDVFDRRAHADLDELKRALLEKLDQVDMRLIDARLDRIETTMANIETATVNLNKTMAGSVEALPAWMTRKIKAEGEKVASEMNESP